jgi:hypothetical protein
LSDIRDCQQALETHIQSQGAKISSGADFNPFQSSLSSTAGQAKIAVTGKDGQKLDTYDPNAMASEIHKIKVEQMVTLSIIKDNLINVEKTEIYQGGGP